MKHIHFTVARRMAVGLLCALLCLGGTACSDHTYDPSSPNGGNGTVNNGVGSNESNGHYALSCNGNEYTVSQKDAVLVDGSALVLVKAGTYIISGERQGQIRVKVAKTEQVTLVLDGLTATCADSAPLYIESADRVYIEVPEGKTSTLTDAQSYVFPAGEDKPNACIYGSDDLTFRGSGTLVVNGHFNNGIGCKNDVVIESGTVTVSGPNNAIKGNGSVTITGTATVTVTNGEDGIKSDSLTADKGYVLIDGNAVVSVTCLDDALQAVSYITVADTARVTYKCEGKATNCDGVVNVAEGSMTPME